MVMLPVPCRKSGMSQLGNHTIGVTRGHKRGPIKSLVTLTLFSVPVISPMYSSEFGRNLPIS